MGVGLICRAFWGEGYVYMGMGCREGIEGIVEGIEGIVEGRVK